MLDATVQDQRQAILDSFGAALESEDVAGFAVAGRLCLPWAELYILARSH
ncbi:MAG: hypothetical protein AAF409_10375 [Pseudomonadota bacterium]